MKVIYLIRFNLSPVHRQLHKHRDHARHPGKNPALNPTLSGKVDAAFLRFHTFPIFSHI